MSVRSVVAVTATLPKSSGLGSTCRTPGSGAVPLPVNGTVAVPPLLVMVRLAAAGPVAVGV